jgi:hypothetical protein
MLLIKIFVELRMVAGRSRKRSGSPQAVSRRPFCAVALRRTAWSEHGMGAAWARHAMCESALRLLLQVVQHFIHCAVLVKASGLEALRFSYKCHRREHDALNLRRNLPTFLRSPNLMNRRSSPQNWPRNTRRGFCSNLRARWLGGGGG